MADFDLVISGNLVLAHRIVNNGFVAVREGKIAFVGRGTAPAGREQIDARGQFVMPGVIDGQVHSGSQANQEGLGRASRAAAAGGVCTMVDMPYDDPEPVWHGELLRAKAKQVARECHVDVALSATISEAHGTSTIAGLIEAGACAFKFSTFEAAPGRFPRIEEDLLHDAFALIAPSGLACGVHNQMQDLTRKNVAHFLEVKDTGWDAYGRAHTPLIEHLATALIFELGALTGARAHVVHCSLARGFDLCASYQAAGHKASIETSVQYLMLNGEADMQRLGAKLKQYPPARPQSEVELLWTQIAAGRCTFVSSDHVAWSLERKSNPNIFKNSSGGPARVLDRLRGARHLPIDGGKDALRWARAPFPVARPQGLVRSWLGRRCRDRRAGTIRIRRLEEPVRGAVEPVRWSRDARAGRRDLRARPTRLRRRADRQQGRPRQVPASVAEERGTNEMTPPARGVLGYSRSLSR
jgi:allantoinase